MQTSQSGSDNVPKGELALLLLLACVQFTHIMDFMILMPLGPQLMRLFDITPRQFGFLVSAYTFSAGIFGFFSAFLVDRFDRKKSLLFCYVGFAAGTLACALAPSYMFLLLARSLAGAFGGALGAMILSIVADVVPQVRRGRAMGIVMASFSVSSIFGVPFGLWLASLFSWHAPFLFVAGIAVINIVALYIRLPALTQHLESGRPFASPLQVLSNITGDRNLLWALGFTLVLMLSQFTIIPFFSPYMVANVGFSESQLAYIYFLGGGLTIFTSPLIGRLADRIGKAKVFTMASFCILPSVLAVTHLGPTPIAIALIVSTSFFIFGNGRFVPAMAMITSTVRPEMRGSFMSINSCVQSLASGTAAFISGLIVQKSASGELQNYNYIGYLSVVISIIAIFVGRKLRPIET